MPQILTCDADRAVMAVTIEWVFLPPAMLCSERVAAPKDAVADTW